MEICGLSGKHRIGDDTFTATRRTVISPIMLF